LAKTKKGNINIFHFLFLPKGKNTKAEYILILISLVTTNDTQFVYILQSLLTTSLIGIFNDIDFVSCLIFILLNAPINKAVKRDWSILTY
jgi:hypothetical protein